MPATFRSGWHLAMEASQVNVLPFSSRRYCHAFERTCLDCAQS